MKSEFPLYFRGALCGKVTAARHGACFTFNATCSACGNQIARVYLIDAAGGAVCLGILAPDPCGVFAATRTYSQAALLKAAISQDGICRAEVRCDDDLWQPCADPTHFVRDSALKSSLSGAQNVLISCDSETGNARIAVPFLRDAPFPLAPAFSVATCIDIFGARYVTIDIGGSLKEQ